MIALAELNALARAAFVDTLHGIFEHSPWIPERAHAQAPFASRQQLLDAMRAVAVAATVDEQLGLIRAHPELAGKAAVRNELTVESLREQTGAGLDACSPEEFTLLQRLNTQYCDTFGFPFIVAVKGHTRATIIAAIETRLRNDAATERAESLRQIGRIAEFRLADLVSEPLGASIMAMAERLSIWSDDAEHLTCAYLTPAHRATAAQIRDWMLAAGMETRIDAVGNVVGRLRGSVAGAKALLTGSHYDTVRNAGKYDGRLGILLPIAVAKLLREQGRQLPYDLEVIGFAEEEGVRFKSTFLGSNAVVGRFDHAVLDSVDGDARRMRDVMAEAGLDPAGIDAEARDPAQLLGFLEVHIEQGPVLLERQLPVGIVTSIAGSVRFMVEVSGTASHAGTTPMNMRRDAGAAAAEMVLAVEARCGRDPAASLVGTVGQLQVPNGSVNVIPGSCKFSIDLRAADDTLRNDAIADVLAALQAIATRRKVGLRFTQTMQAPCAPCAPRLMAQIEAAVRRAGVTPFGLPSGAGHDAMTMAKITDMAMLFVRCGNGGISHNPLEIMTVEDADLAARIFLDVLEHLH